MNFKIAALTVGLVTFGAISSLQATPAKFDKYTKPVKHGEFLYEMSYKDYTENWNTVAKKGSMACSSVRNGNFYGRNLDFFYDNMPEFVIHMAAKEGRFASIAVCGSFKFEAADIEKGIDQEDFLSLPMGAFDGINERGVCANVNVVPAEDTAPVTGTNPGKPKMHISNVVRFILNKASSAKEAIELLDGYDIYGSLGHYSMHFMINDAKETYIVEFIDNKIKWTKQNIMVNFYHTLPEITKFGSGVERYKILTDNYAEGATFDGMCSLMQRVKYSKTYNKATDPFWYSEYVNADGPDGKKLTVSSPKENFAKLIDDAVADFIKRDRATGFEKNIWHTVHTSVYDITARKLRLYVQEDYEHPFEFQL